MTKTSWMEILASMNQSVYLGWWLTMIDGPGPAHAHVHVYSDAGPYRRLGPAQSWLSLGSLTLHPIAIQQITGQMLKPGFKSQSSPSPIYHQNEALISSIFPSFPHNQIRWLFKRISYHLPLRHPRPRISPRHLELCLVGRMVATTSRSVTACRPHKPKNKTR